MLILGLAGGKIAADGTIVPGSAGVGKDVVADYLVKRYGFVKFAFSDALYDEVQRAYDLPDQSLLRDRETKDTPQDQMALGNCSDDMFTTLAQHMWGITGRQSQYPSPRQILQLWGTEYRRAQDPDYWLEKCEEFLDVVRAAYRYPEHRPMHFVNTTCRFPNEQAWLHDHGGNVWHIRRPVTTTAPVHVSEKLLPVLDGERELWNCDTIERLWHGIDLLMSSGAQFVKVLPMERETDRAHAT